MDDFYLRLFAVDTHVNGGCNSDLLKAEKAGARRK